MRFIFRIVLLALLVLSLSAGIFAGSLNSLLKQIGLPEYPGSNLTTELNLPAGKLLDELAKEVGPWLGFQELKAINVLVYGIDSVKPSRDVFAFYEQAMEKEQWNTLASSFRKEDGMAVLYNENKGMLIMNIDPAGRQDRELTLIRAAGKMDPGSVADPTQKLPSLMEKMVTAALGSESAGSGMTAVSKIPIGQPISVLPSGRLHLKATRSDIKASVLSQNTAEIQFASRVDDPGELTRTDDRLVLALTPKVQVEEILLPGTIPLLIEITEGSLTLSGGPGPNDRPVDLSIVSTGAPVMLEQFPLISGTIAIRSVGGEIRADLSRTQGGTLMLQVTGQDVILSLTKDASVGICVHADKIEKIENLTGLEPRESSANQMILQAGADKGAEIDITVSGGIARIMWSN